MESRCDVCQTGSGPADEAPRASFRVHDSLSDTECRSGSAYLGHKQGAGVDDVNEVPQPAEEGTLQEDHVHAHHTCFHP